MNIRTIRNIDVWLGKPACFALTAFRRLTRAFGPAPAGIRRPRKILLIKMTEQGATVLAAKAAQRAIEIVGRENVYVWVFAENRPILDIMGLIPPENVLAVKADGAIGFAMDIWRTLRRIRKIGIDATVDMELFARAPAVLAYLTGANSRVGLDRFTSEGPYRGDLLTHRVLYNPHQHVAAQYHALVESLLADPRQVPMLKAALPPTDYAPPAFTPSPAEVAAARALLERLAGGPVASPVILLNPNASDMLPLRKWPTDRFVDLGRRLLAAHPGATIAITGAPSEAAVAGAVAREIGPGVLTLAGQTTLRELMVIYTLADVLVTNDSGPGHFSSMTDVDTLVLFGPETPALYSPLGRRSHVLWAGIACSPCVNAMNHRFSPCRDNVCMQVITVDEVAAKVTDVLRRRAGGDLTHRLPVLAGAG